MLADPGEREAMLIPEAWKITFEAGVKLDGGG